MTDARINARQQTTGIEPAKGDRAKYLKELSMAAYELIQIIELERSGIRDGDGRWHGSDPLQGKVLQISDRCQWARRAAEHEAKGDTFLDDFLP